MASADSTTLLYNAENKIVYKDSNHRYAVDGKSTPSVTTILSAVIAKPDLMLWPLNLAMKQLEEAFLENGTLTWDDLHSARSAHIQKREKGANTGTAVHAIAEQRLLLPANKRLKLENVPLEVGMAAYAFETWFLNHKPKVLGAEQVVYSRKLGYVGTYDSILRIDGKTYLCDLKTTSATKAAPLGIYGEYFVQLAAYYAAYEEQRQYELKTTKKTKLKQIDDLMVISARKDGVLDTMTLSSLQVRLPDVVELWEAVVALYIGLKDLKKKVKGAST